MKIIVSILLSLIALLIAAYFIVYYVSMRHTKTPSYELIEKVGNIEQRHYQPMLIAKVDVNGEREQAINRGFRLLAAYIFGDNNAANSQKIAMTAPVLQQQKIAMTAPVMQTETATKQWQVSFVMPSEYNLSNLPTPNDGRIHIEQIPAQDKIVIRFSGRMSQANLQQHWQRLQDYVEQQQLTTEGMPTYAFYNPPWTLPFMRRNEILWTIKKPTD